jgi:hypothetical protein
MGKLISDETAKVAKVVKFAGLQPGWPGQMFHVA